MLQENHIHRVGSAAKLYKNTHTTEPKYKRNICNYTMPLRLGYLWSLSQTKIKGVSAFVTFSEINRGITDRKVRNGILLWKLFWPTVRKEMFLRSRMFSWDHKNNFFDQEQVRKWYFVDFELWNFFLKIFIEQNYKIILKSNFISCWLKVCDFTYWMKDRSLESWKVLHCIYHDLFLL